MFTFDLLLALIPITLILGYSLSAMTTLQEEIRGYGSRTALERIASDAIDQLVKNPGEPPNWEATGRTDVIPGLAMIIANHSHTNRLDLFKLAALNYSVFSNLFKNESITAYKLAIDVFGLEEVSAFLDYGSLNDSKEVVRMERVSAGPPAEPIVYGCHLTHFEQTRQIECGYFGDVICGVLGQGQPVIYGYSFYVSESDKNIYNYYFKVDNLTCDKGTFGQSAQYRIWYNFSVPSTETIDPDDYYKSFLGLTCSPAFPNKTLLKDLREGTGPDALDGVPVFLDENESPPADVEPYVIDINDPSVKEPKYPVKVGWNMLYLRVDSDPACDFDFHVYRVARLMPHQDTLLYPNMTEVRPIRVILLVGR